MLNITFCLIIYIGVFNEQFVYCSTESFLCALQAFLKWQYQQFRVSRLPFEYLKILKGYLTVFF